MTCCSDSRGAQDELSEERKGLEPHPAVAAGPEGKVPLMAALGFLHWDRQLKSN